MKADVGIEQIRPKGSASERSQLTSSRVLPPDGDRQRFVCPLIEDLRSQKTAFKRFLIRSLVLIALFLLLDRCLGFVLLRGLDRYYSLDVPAQVLCVGHSHTVLGIDKVALEHALGVPVAKFAVEGANTADRLIMIQYYLKRQPSSVRAIVYDVDAHTFTSSGLSSSSYRLLFPFISDPDIRGYVRRNCSSRAEYLVRRLFWTPRYDELTISLAVRGYLQNWANLKPGKIDPNVVSRQIKEGRYRKIAFDPDNIRQLEETIRIASERSQLFLTYIPTVDILNRAEPEKFHQAMSMFANVVSTNPTVAFLDYNRVFETRHELFRDPIHLNRDGQRELTARLASDLAGLIRSPALVSVGPRKRAAK